MTAASRRSAWEALTRRARCVGVDPVVREAALHQLAHRRVAGARHAAVFRAPAVPQRGARGDKHLGTEPNGTLSPGHKGCVVAAYWGVEACETLPPTSAPPPVARRLAVRKRCVALGWQRRRLGGAAARLEVHHVGVTKLTQPARARQAAVCEQAWRAKVLLR